MTEVGYKYLKTYQLSIVLFILGNQFCDIYFVGFENRRTREQAIQALRSHKQNIVEGYDDPRTIRFREFRVFWDFDKDPEAPKVRNLPDDPEIAANFLLTLAHQQSYLLSQQIKSLENKFVNEGGYTENLFKKRLEVKLNDN